MNLSVFYLDSITLAPSSLSLGRDKVLALDACEGDGFLTSLEER